MTELRPIEDIYTIDKEHWVGSGFRVRNYFPEGRNLLDRFSPFALMDYNPPINFNPSKTPRGIGPHPHRGLETVTLVFQGSVEHHDNQGNHGVIYPGDVQWMTAGSGIMHKEYHEKSFQENGGVFQVVQLWTSLPKKDKFTAPRYQELVSDQMGKFDLPEDAGEITIVSGEVNRVKGPAKTYSPINLYTLDLMAGKSTLLTEPANYNTGILIINGDAKVNNKECQKNDFILFENKTGIIQVQASTSKLKLLVLSGLPLEEPAFAAGPFVMNTKEELRQASQDYRDGKFGTENF